MKSMSSRPSGRFVLVTAALCLWLPIRAAHADPAKAYKHLSNVMDRFNGAFDVFTDLAAAGNHFAARCAVVRNAGSIGDLAGVSFDDGWTKKCRSGSTCMKNTFVAVDPTYWGGWYLQNGVLLSGDRQPRCNWGDYPDAGFDLTGATTVTFWARGERGGERVEVFAGGIGRDAVTGVPTKPYYDSFARVPAVGQTITLTKKWTRYTIPLTGQDLHYVVGGLGWVANAQNNPGGAVFYLDDIQYDKPRLNDLRLLVSFDVLSKAPGDNFDTILRNVAFSYDNAVAILSYLARANAGDVRRAALLADAFVYAQDHDRYYSDGRLRNAYQAGDLILPPGWTPNDRLATARMPGWWDVDKKEWLEDQGHVGTDTGNMAWIMLSLLRAHQKLGTVKYLSAAQRIGTWIAENTYDVRGVGGYTGGYEGWEPDPSRRFWKSTEHNLDAYVAFMTLSDLTPEPDRSMWRSRALHAKHFVIGMWGACGDSRFATGTTVDGVTPNCDLNPEDVNTWGLMALGEAALFGPGADWVEVHCRATEACLGGASAIGIDFNDDGDGIWWEGTGHTVIADRLLGRTAQADALLQALRGAQVSAPRANGRGMVAACRDGVTTGIEGFLLFNRLHVGATAWYVLAELRHNPYWGISTSGAIPHEGER